MQDGNQQSIPSSLGLSNANINTLVIVDEPEENSIVLAWKGKGFKRLPYDEHKTNTGQTIRTFMTFGKDDKVTVVTVNKEHLSITLTIGTIENNHLKTIGEPLKYYGTRNVEDASLKYTSKMPADGTVMFFSLTPENFGEEVKGRMAESYDNSGQVQRVMERELSSFGVLGIAQDGTEKPYFFAQRIRVINE